MVYTEVQRKNKSRYFYRVKSVRQGLKVGKKRVYMGANLSKKKVLEKEKQADKELKLLSSLLSEQEIKSLAKIKENYFKQPVENLKNRYEAFCSLFTYDSTAIEGNSFTLQETAELLFEKRVPAYKSLREVNEILNHKLAFDLILKTKNDISKQLILDLHKLVVKNTLKQEIEDQAGRYRSVQVYIRGVEWIPPKPNEVPREMKNLLLWYSKNEKKLHPLIVAVYFHSAFELIHPFVDGNGRTGRLLMNLILHRNKLPMINIPNSKKHKYYEVLSKSQVDGDLRHFIEFMIELMNEEEIRL